MIPAARWLDPLRTWLPVARAGQDADGVHQVRVASRRLDAWLRLGGVRVLRDDLRWLRVAVADARDLDVLLERELPDDVRAWLAGQRAEAQPRVAEVVTDPRTAALLDALARWPALDGATAKAGVRRVIRQVERRGEAVAAGSRDPESLHRLRRALRRLRFSLSWVGEEHALLVELQEVFGALNDAALLLRWLDRYPRVDRHGRWRSEIAAAADRDRDAVIAAWDRSRPHLEALHTTWTSS